MERTYALDLQEQDLNLVLMALGEMKYKTVARTINRIVHQIDRKDPETNVVPLHNDGTKGETQP